jgi:PAS domain S-box-containing protein
MDAGTVRNAPHILILEDDLDQQDLILRAFRDDPEPFRVSFAGTVRKAQEIIGCDPPPDLLIADWNLPDGKGIEILPRREGMVTIPLIIMTGYGDEHLAVEIMKSGAIDYVVKSATIFHEMPHISRRALRDWNNIQERKRAEQEKQDSEKHLADILSFLPDAVLAIDNEGRVIAWNEAIEQMTGVASESMLGKGNYEYSIPFYGERRPILIDLVNQGDDEIGKKYPLLQRDGNRISSEVYIPTIFGGKGAYLWGTATPLFDTAGNRIGAIEIIRDITERKNAELVLQQKEAILETLLNAPHDTIALLDREGTILGINEEGARRVGGNVQGVTGRCAYDLLPPDVAGARKVQIDRVFESGMPTRFDDTRTGMYLYNEIFPIFNPEHTSVDRVAIFARDITLQKQVELALQDSETRYRDLFENMSSGVAIYEATPDNKDFIIRDINRAVENIEQVRKNEIIGKSVLQVFPGVVEFGLFAVFQRVAKTGIAESHPVSMYRDNRISGWRENYVYKLPSGEIVALYQDVTEKKQAEDETRCLLIAFEEEKEKLSSLINSITDEVWFTDTQHRFTLANPAAIKEFGLDHRSETDVENLIKGLEILRPDGTLRPLEEAPPLRALAGEIVSNMEEIVRTPARGELRYRQVSSAPVKDSFGTIIGAVSVVRDVTGQKQAVEALRESEERYRSVVENASEGIVVAQEGKLQYANTRALELIQLNPEEIGNQPFTDFIHPDDRALVFERYQRRLLGENVPESYDFRIIGKNKKMFWIQLSGVKILWSGKPATLNFFMDITKRKQEEETLKSTREWLGIALRAAHAWTWDWDFPTGRLTWSPEFFELFGLSSDKTPSFEVWLDVLHPDDREPAQATIKRSIENHTPLWNEYRVILPDGEVRWIGAAGSTTYTDAGEPVRMSGVCIDINSRKLAEEKFRESENRFRVAQELSPDGFTILHPVRDNNGEVVDFTWIYENQTIARLNATDPQNVIGKRLLDMFPAHKGTPIFEAYIQAADTGTPQIIEDTYVGEILSRPTWLRLVIVPMDKDIAILAQDITERKAAEQIRKQYTARLNSAMEIGSLAWWEMDLPDGAVRFDDYKATMLGYLPEQFHHYTDFTALLHPEDYGPAMQAMKDHLEGKEARYHADYRIQASDGNYLWFRDVGGLTSRHPDGTPATITGIVIDITTSKKAEAQIKTTLHQLEHSEALLRKVYDILPIGLWLADKHGKLLYGNPAGVKIWGAEPHVPIEQYGVFKARRYPSGEEIAAEDWALAHTIQEGVTIKDELLEIDAFDGKKKIIVNYTAPLLDTAGAIDGAIIVNQEITDKINAEKALRLSEERLSLSLEATSDGLWDWDLVADHVFWSPRAYEMLGYAPDEFAVNFAVWKDLLHPDDREATEKNVMTQLHEGNRFTAEFRYRRKDGSWIWILGRGRAVAWDTEGNVTRMVGTHVDLTEQKNAENALRDNQAQLATAMDIAGLVNWEFDVASGMFTFDDRFYALYETTADREGGNQMSAETYLREFVYPDDRPAVLAEIEKIITTKDPHYAGRMEHRITPRDGSVRNIISQFAPIMDPDGNVIRTFGTNQDITDFKLMESEIRSLNIVLEQRVKERTEALVETNKRLNEENAQRIEAEGKLQASYDEKVMLLKEIHHRVKNNLQIIASLLNLQSRYITDQKTLAAIKESQNRVKAMALVHEKLYRSEDIAHISLRDYIRFLGTGLFQFYDAQIRGIQFRLEISDIDVNIDAAIPLGLIINELISNSLKYAFPEGRTGEVFISVKKEGPSLNVLFHDTGIGIPEDLDWRDAPSLGLRLVITLVDQMDGTVELNRSDGTTFTMVLHEKEPRGEK